VPSYDENIYYNPQNAGVRPVAALDVYDPDWDFDIFIVIQGPDGKVYVGNDSGCSCPTPFEDHTFPQDFTEVQSWADVKREYDARFPATGSYRARRSVQDIRHAVVGAFRRGA
jgi:hypothetical protein